jgi:hypothetical protein
MKTLLECKNDVAMNLGHANWNIAEYRLVPSDMYALNDKATEMYANQFKEENERLRAKAERWDALESKIGKFYEDDSDADLGDIGEAAAVAFGYL